jgi:hypothetical protein
MSSSVFVKCCSSFSSREVSLGLHVFFRFCKMLLFLSSPDFFRSEKTRFFPFGKNPTDSKVSTAFSFRFQKKHAQLYTTTAKENLSNGGRYWKGLI